MLASRLIPSILLWALGLYFAISGRTGFMLGGDPDSPFNNNRSIHVNATGTNAIAIGVFVIGLGTINLALGIRDRARIPVFWIGASLLAAPVLFAIIQFIRDQIVWFSQP